MTNNVGKMRVQNLKQTKNAIVTQKVLINKDVQKNL